MITEVEIRMLERIIEILEGISFNLTLITIIVVYWGISKFIKSIFRRIELRDYKKRREKRFKEQNKKHFEYVEEKCKSEL